MPESDFLSLVGWAGNSFPLYREQVLAPIAQGGTTLGLNIPRHVSSKVAQQGPNSLTPAEKALLPPIWELGSPTYFARFSEAMSGHVSEAQITRYFWAQSLWDDTMAWKGASHLHAHPDQALVILVGQFHAEFSDGLPARLLRHGATQVKVVIQHSVSAWDQTEIDKLVAPDPVYGQRADFIWIWK